MARLIAALAALLLGGRAVATPVDDLQRDDSLAQSIGWRLLTANASACPDVAAATGIQVQDTAAYDDPALARARYGLSGDIFVGALADDSPGAASGLTVNTTIIAIAGQPLTALPAPPPRTPYARLQRVQALLDDAAARDGVVALTGGGGRVYRVATVPACRVAIMVDDDRTYANATRGEIRIGRRLFDATEGNRDVIAAIIAHELAHAVLDHESQLAQAHRSLAVRRRTEREADRLSVWLLAKAGYPPAAALDFQRTLVARYGGPLAIDLTHGGWRARSRIIAAEIATLTASPDADWPLRFRREPDR